MIIRYATEKDEEQILEYDEHISDYELSKSVASKRVYVAKTDDGDILFGFARYNLFWDNTPFLNMIYVPDGYNRMGVGSGLLKFWESDMKKQGYSILLTSTQANERGQHFFRKRGFQDCGNLLLPNDDNLELILMKEI